MLQQQNCQIPKQTNGKESVIPVVNVFLVFLIGTGKPLSVPLALNFDIFVPAACYGCVCVFASEFEYLRAQVS